MQRQCNHTAHNTYTQAVPTHQALQSNDVMDALLGLLRSPHMAVVEHAASVFSVMANNPATHFQVRLPVLLCSRHWI